MLRAALDAALSFAEKFGAAVELLHAWEVPAYLRPDLTVWTGDVGTTLVDHARAEAERGLAAFMEDAMVAGRAGVSSRIVAGTPASAVLDAISKDAPDLVVMGTHGRTGLSHVLLGSVAERVVRASKVPVLTVRPPPAG